MTPYKHRTSEMGTHRFEGRMDDDMFEALNSHVEKSEETKGEVFRKAMSLYLRAKREDSYIVLRNKNDPSKIVELVGI